MNALASLLAYRFSDPLFLRNMLACASFDFITGNWNVGPGDETRQALIQITETALDEYARFDDEDYRKIADIFANAVTSMKLRRESQTATALRKFIQEQREEYVRGLFSDSMMHIMGMLEVLGLGDYQARMILNSLAFPQEVKLDAETATTLANILKATDPEGTDGEWSYLPQAEEMLKQPGFVTLCKLLASAPEHMLMTDNT